MKSFRFRLQRILSWRGTQLSLAEANVEQLRCGARATDQAIMELLQSGASAQATVERAMTVSGADLRALEVSRVWAVREEKRLSDRKVKLQQSIEVQNGCVADARRGVKLVERLKQRQYETWKAEAERELDELAAESALGQWRRSNL